MSPDAIGYIGCNTLADVLQRVAEDNAGRPALVDKGRQFTFAELERDVEALSAHFHRRRIGAPSACAVLMNNAYEHVVAWFAVQRAGLTLVPVNVNLAPPEVAHQLVDAQVDAVVVSPELAAKLVPSTGGETCSLDALVVIDSWHQDPLPDASLPPGTATTIERVRLADLPRADFRATTTREDVALIWYTSGTTGRPKGAIHTHSSCLNAVAAWIAEWDWHPEDRGLVRNLYHVGMMATVVALLLSGASLAFAGPFSIENYLSSVEQHGVTILRTFPVMLALIDKRPELMDRFDLRRVRRVGVGGSGIDHDLLRRSIERFPTAQWDYSWSQSELNSGGTNVSGPSWFSRLGSCGRPIGCIESLSIHDDSGRSLGPGEVGEVCIRSTTEMIGYLGAPEETAAVKRAGWLHTGDLGYLDAEGYLYLVARQREVIIRGGENIYPAEIERVIGAHPAVDECVAVGIPDSVMVEVPVAFVVVRPGESVTQPELHALVEDNLARYKRPTRIQMIDEIPRNALGKVQRALLTEAATKYAR